MADIAKLGIEIDSSQVKTANRELGRLESRGKSVQSQFTDMGRSAQRLGQSMSLYLTAPIVAGGAMAVKTASEYERLQVQLEVLVGSAEKAEKVFNRLTEFAATTPFELEGITTANNMLLGFGFSAQRAFEMLDTLGDISAVSGADLKTLARITGEARAENKLLTRDLRQLINNGIPIIDILADSLGVATNQIFEMATQGEISFQILIDAFEKTTAAGGLYEDGMEKLSKTMGGLWSNFIDATDLALASLGDTIIKILDLKQVLRDVVAQIERASDWFNELDESQQRMIITLTGILAAAGPVIFMLGTLSVAIGAISPVVAGVAAAVAVGTAAIVNNWEEVEGYFTSGGGAQMWEDIKSIVSEAIELVTGLWDEYGDFLMEKIEKSLGFVLDVMEFTFDRMSTMMKKLNGTMDTELNIFEDNWMTTLDKIEAKVINFGMSLVMLTGKWVGQTFNLIDTEYDKLRKEFEQRGLEFDVGLIVTEDDLERMRTFLDKVKEMERKVEFQGDLKGLSQTMAFNEEMGKTISNLNTIGDDWQYAVDVSKLWESSVTKTTESTKDWAEAQKKANEYLRDTRDALPSINGEALGNMPGSIAAMRDELIMLQNAQNQVNLSTEAGVVAYNEIGAMIDEAEGKINELTGATKQQNDMARQLGFTFSSAFEDAIIGGNSFREVLKGLLDDIARIILRMQVIEPLANMLGGALGGIGSGGGAKVTATGDAALFGGGGATNVTDALIRPDGKIINFHPDDNILAFQGEPSKKLPGGGGANVNVNVINQNGSQVDVETRETPSGIDVQMVVRNQVKDMINSGKLDREFSANFGVRRGGVNRG